ncbi:MAG: hypothetical protein P4N59_18335 [Negativicutes bacterium]|nr:hypothetical protein [Negativicutes bacterium]
MDNKYRPVDPAFAARILRQFSRPFDASPLANRGGGPEDVVGKSGPYVPAAVTLVRTINNIKKYGDEVKQAAQGAGFGDAEAEELAHNAKMLYGTYKGLSVGSQATAGAVGGSILAGLDGEWAEPKVKDWIKNTVIQNRKDMNNQGDPDKIDYSVFNPDSGAYGSE